MPRKSLHSSINNLSYKSLLIILFFLLISIVVLWKFVLPNHKVSASWWNDGWNYRKAISVTNSSGSNLTDFQMSISIGTSALIASGKMQSDCDDIRITDINGNLLPYWIEENNPGCNQLTDTKIWIKANSLPTSGSTIFIYYGNTSAPSAQNGKNVFELFDDFSSGFNDWTIFTGIHYGGTLAASVSGGQLILSGVNAEGGIYKNNYNTVDGVVEFMARADQLRNGNDMAAIARRQNNTQYYDMGINWGDNTTARISKDASHVNLASTSYTYGSGVFRLISGYFSGSSLRTYIDNNFKIGVTDTTYATSGNVGISMDAAHESSGLNVQWTIDNFRVRKYASVEPTATLQSEEAGGGPIAYWKFDEGVGTTVYDSSPNQNNGVFGTGSASPTWANESQCISGKCISLQQPSYIDVSNKPSLSAITISTWVKFNSFNTLWQNNIIYRGNPEGGSGFYIRAWASGTIQFLVGNNSGSYIGINTGNLTTNKWYHIVGVAKIGEPLKLYIDNKLYSGSVITDMNLGNTSNINFGSANYTMNGFIDETKIYPYARTADQIKQDYNSRGSSKGTTANLGGAGSDNNLSDGLVGYWKMDEGVGTSITDYSGKSITGTTVPAWSSGKYGIGISLNGTTDRISMSNLNPIGTAENGFTLSAWIYQNGDQSGKQILYFSGIQLRPGYFFTNNGSFQQLSFTPPAINSWHHIVGTFDGQYMKVYIDGTYINQISVTGNIIDASDFKIGGRYDDAEDFNGKIDEVRIYNRALSPSEVTQLYEYAPGPVGYWDFEENTGTVAKDKSGSNNNGTWQGTGSHWTQGKYGSAGNFNGTNDLTGILYSPLLAPTGSITFSAWVYKNNWTSAEASRIISKTETGGYTLLFSSSTIYAYIYRNGAYATPGTSTSGLSPGWHYFTGSYDGRYTKIYVDGTLQNTDDAGANYPITYSVNNTLFIGAEADGDNDLISAGNFFTGKIDEVKIYNYIRTQKQIIEDMNGGSQAASAKSVLIYHKFDEGSGTTTYNSGNGGIGITGIFGSGSSAPTWINEGKSGKALQFNGTQFLNIGYNTSSTQDYTISAWFKTTSTNGMIFCDSHNNFTDFNRYIYLSSGKLNTQHWPSTIYGNKTVNDSNWHQAVSVVDKTNGKIYLYVDGTLDVGGTNTGTGVVTITNLMVGINGMKTQGFTGLIDEVKFYNYALTADEVKQDYNQNSTIQMGQTSQTIGGTTTSLQYCIPGDTSYCAAPVAEYNFEENTGTTTKDSSGNNNTGTFGTGSSAPTWSPGVNNKGSGLKFDGVNDYVTMSNYFNLSPATLEFWFKANSWSNSPLIIGKDSAGPNNGYIQYVSSQLRFYAPGNTVTANWGNPSLNTWHHATLVITGSQHLTYLDGISVGTTTSSSLALFTGNYNFKIGCYDNGILAFNGSVDGVKIYNYARTPAQVAYDYNKGGPIGWWKFDECQGSVANDSSGIGNTGSIIIGSSGSQNSLGTCQIGTSAAWTNDASGHTNSSLNFDGTDDYVSFGDISTLEGMKGITTSAWIYRKTDMGNNETILSKYWDGTDRSYFMLVSSGDQLRCLIPTDTNNDNDSAFGSTINLNQWYFVTCTWDSTTGLIKAYVNGNYINQQSQPGNIIRTNSSPIQIGRDYYANSQNSLFSGQIDDVRIYNYALTPEQVKTLYNGGSVSFN